MTEPTKKEQDEARAKAYSSHKLIIISAAEERIATIKLQYDQGLLTPKDYVNACIDAYVDAWVGIRK